MNRPGPKILEAIESAFRKTVIKHQVNSIQMDKSKHENVELIRKGLNTSKGPDGHPDQPGKQ
jgi:hypothetical protein